MPDVLWFDSMKSGLAFVAAANELGGCGEAYDDIDDPLKLGHVADDKVDDIQIHIQETTETDEAPVQCTDDDKPVSKHAYF